VINQVLLKKSNSTQENYSNTITKLKTDNKELKINLEVCKNNVRQLQEQNDNMIEDKFRLETQ